MQGQGLRAGEVLASEGIADFTGDFTDAACLHEAFGTAKSRLPRLLPLFGTIDIAAPLAVVLVRIAEGRPVCCLQLGVAVRCLSGMSIVQPVMLCTPSAASEPKCYSRSRVPEDLIGLWLGHAKKTITDVYADGLKNDIQWRREWCEKVGLGFSVGLFGLENQTVLLFRKAA